MPPCWKTSHLTCTAKQVVKKQALFLSRAEWRVRQTYQRSERCTVVTAPQKENSPLNPALSTEGELALYHFIV